MSMSQRGGWRKNLAKKTSSGLLFIILFLLLVVLGGFIWLLLTGQIVPFQPNSEGASPLSSPSPVLSLAPSPTPGEIVNLANLPSDQGLFVLAVEEGATTHLFAYHPQYLALTRLTAGEWDDITPALSPDHTRLAYASNRNGQWDIYVMEIETGNVSRITNTLTYDANPSWSPDGLWMAYETYIDDNLEIVIQSLSDQSTPIRLTYDPGADYAPAWSPQGRQIAFVSMNSGENEIWLADLDKVEDRFHNLSNNTDSIEEHPVWSPDGTYLAWSGNLNGMRGIYVWDSRQPDVPGRYLEGGDWPAWSPAGDQIAVRFSAPNRQYLTAYRFSDGTLVIPPMGLGGSLQGLLWENIRLSAELPPVYTQAYQITPMPLWNTSLSVAPDLPVGRYKVVPLDDVSAPYPMLHDLVDESFQAMRANLAKEIGWDFLANLENAYVPLTSPAMPDMEGRWLYTGRAFAFNDLPLNAGWLSVIREDFYGQTYWRVYLRCLAQDGSQGKPLDQQPWDFHARFNGDPIGYEHGGLKISSPPQGYWFDFTDFARSYGWQRLPSYSSWRSFYQAIRFNEFAYTDGLDWRSAILEVYPPEMLITPTPFLSPTPTVTPSLTPTITPTITLTPKWTDTPWPTRTATFTKTPTPSITPLPSDMPTPTSVLH